MVHISKCFIHLRVDRFIPAEKVIVWAGEVNNEVSMYSLHCIQTKR